MEVKYTVNFLSILCLCKQADLFFIQNYTWSVCFTPWFAPFILKRELKELDRVLYYLSIVLKLSYIDGLFLVHFKSLN